MLKAVERIRAATAAAGEHAKSATSMGTPSPDRKIKLFSKKAKKPIDILELCAIIQKLSGTANRIWGYSSAGRALEWHSRGQRFDPAYLHHRVLKTNGFQDFFFVKTVVFPLKCHFFEPGRYTRFARYTLS